MPIGDQPVLVQPIGLLVTGDGAQGPYLLLVAVHVWVTNVMGYAFVFRWLDRSRLYRQFAFPQQEPRGRPVTYFDYLYLSASNAMAFSPTDVMPLTHRAKALMLAESLTGFVLVVLVIGRSFSIIG